MYYLYVHNKNYQVVSITLFQYFKAVYYLFQVEFHPNKYFENTIVSLKYQVRLNIKRLREPVDKTR